MAFSHAAAQVTHIASRICFFFIEHDVPFSRKYWRELNFAVWSKMKLTWYWWLLLWLLKGWSCLLFITYVPPSIDEGHACDGMVHYRKLYLRTSHVQTILNFNNLRDAVLQTGAQEYYWSIRGGSDIWFIHGSWPCGTKSDFFSSSKAWLSHWPRKRYSITNLTYNIYLQILIWQFASKTTTSPNLIPRQYFRLYSMLTTLFPSHIIIRMLSSWGSWINLGLGFKQLLLFLG